MSTRSTRIWCVNLEMRLLQLLQLLDCPFQVREIDGIPLLLDCSAIDERNPFIMQWVIFAIRNLCHGNKENQEQVAKVDSKGIIARDWNQKEDQMEPA